jgi:sodium-dependent dicarboxylate transporter 2/3/5
MNSSAAVDPPLQRYQLIGRLLGPALFVFMLATAQWQDVMPPIAWRTAGAALWMATWWATEAVPVAATAFLPIILFAPTGISTLKDAAAPYANPIIYLFLGGFMLAIAVERWNLHRRISLAILDQTGTDGRRLVGGFMFVCALLSMWMTNTSTTMMLLPIVLSVIAVIRDNVTGVTESSQKNFQISMLLGLAYAASIGGLATMIGTPPNALLIGYLAETYEIEISFARWMAVGVPVSAVMLPAAWFLMTRVLFRFDIPATDAVNQHLHQLREEMGPMTTPERRVAFVFATVIFCWMLRGPITQWLGLDGVSDAGIVMTAALLMFLIPSGDSKQRQLLKWENASRIPWGVLILFGGGLSLAAAVSNSGLALWLGEGLAPLNAWGLTVLVIAAITLVIFLTELTSNLATTATLLPVMGAIALQIDVPPILLTVPITIAASCAFMLPVATPPNAIVFSTGAITIPQMVRAGIVLNLIGIVVVTLVSRIVAPALLQ